jgi:hypothetical protein
MMGNTMDVPRQEATPATVARRSGVRAAVGIIILAWIWLIAEAEAQTKDVLFSFIVASLVLSPFAVALLKIVDDKR